MDEPSQRNERKISVDTTATEAAGRAFGLIFLAFLIMTSCGCNASAPTHQPRGRRSRYFEDISGSLAVNTRYDPLEMRFTWLVESRKPLPDGAYIEAEFPDPSDPIAGTPYRVPFMRLEQRASEKAAADRYYAVSGPLPKTECRMYDVRLNVYSDSRRISVISQHESQILSRVDTEQCPRSTFLALLKSMQK